MTASVRIRTERPITGEVGDGGPNPTHRSENALDWLNFFVADVQTGFGAFIAVYLASKGWSTSGIGILLTVGTVSAIAAQLPGGALVDGATHKRALVAGALGLVGLSALLFAASPDAVFIFAAQIIHGVTGAVIAPGLTAIGLGLVGQRGLAKRLGRNQRYNSLGVAATAAAMGLLGQFLFKRAAFLFAACLCAPAVWALYRIDGDEIDYARARAAGAREKPREAHGYLALLRNRRLLVFGLVLVLFQIANASATPLVSERLGSGHARYPELVTACLMLVPQLVTALLAGRTAQLANGWGRKPLLLVAFGCLAARILLFAIAPSETWLIPIQALSGVDAAVLGILTPLVVNDLTAGTGRFNLAQGAMGLAVGVGGAVSTPASGVVVDLFGYLTGFLALAAVALLAILVVAVLFPESRPAQSRAGAIRDLGHDGL